MINYLVSIARFVGLCIAAIVFNVHAAIPVILDPKAVLGAITVWDALAALAPLLAPILVLALTAVGKVLLDHERRLRAQEGAKNRQSRTLYGDENDPQQRGLSKDIAVMSDRIDKIESMIEDAQNDIDSLKEEA